MWASPPNADLIVRTRGFFNYLVIGGAIGLVASILLFAIGSTKQLSTLAYAMVVFLVYGGGVATSYLAHSAITFKVRRDAKGAMKHILVCGTSGLAVSVMAALFRMALSETRWDPASTGALSFAAASLIVAAASYRASRVWVFNDPSAGGCS